MTPRKSPTSTYSFGASRRESHDASAFYGRFSPPEISDDSSVNEPSCVNRLICSNASNMQEVADNSVALVVTSPPYFAGKEYEEALGRGDVPSDYLAYLEMLEAVFAECVRVLEPGGRIAVNVANLGRKPYRSLASDVTSILQDRLKLLLRGEVIWLKARGSTGSCAWGTFQRPANPVLRDLTERVIIAGKGRFDRALGARARSKVGLPCDSSMTRDEFMEATTDVWEIPPESATRVGHPAPFPVALPLRLIHLYTYYGDLVLDPFVGSGSTAVAALRSGRHYIGYDTDPSYIELANSRIADEVEQRGPDLCDETEAGSFVLPADSSDVAAGGLSINHGLVSLAEGAVAKQVAHELIAVAGFSAIESDVKIMPGVEVAFRARDAGGNPWCFEVCGGFTALRPGLQRSEIYWKALGKACVASQVQPGAPLVLITTGLPRTGSAAYRALVEVVGPDKPISAVIELGTESGHEVLKQLATASRGRGVHSKKG